MTTCAHCGGYELARRRKSGPALPRSTFGTPEALIDRGTAALSRQTERLGEAIAKAVHGKSSAKAIRAAIIAIGRRWNRERLADPLERELSHGAWLGALDADFEARTNRPVKIESFAALHAPMLLAPYDRSTDPAFATRPVGDAREQFERREAVTRDVYDKMTEAARRRATTVAGAATTEVVRTVQQELVQQVAKGAELRDFAKRVVPRLEAAGWTPQNASHVENVLRTNVSGAYNSGRARQMTQPTVLRFRPFWQIVTVNDGPPRQRPTHQAAHLVVLRADDPFWLTAYPPFGYQCFLPQTQMQGVILGASRAWYSGQAVELTTAKGRRLAVTAKHPILTPQGFAPAGSLRVGDDLICYAGEAGVQHLRRGSQADDNHAPSSAEQVFEALAQAGRPLAARAAAVDFHGEAARFDGDVDVVGSYRELMLAHGAASPQQLQQPALEIPDLPLTLIARACTCHPASHRAGHFSPSDFPGARELPLDEGPVGFDRGPFEPFRIGPAANLDALQPESTLQGGPGNASIASELFQRCPGSIDLDQIVDVRELYWSGHVYDFEGGGGLVVAGGVFASNCRCRVRSLGRRQGEQLVVSGTSIHDLPDRGFTSGLSILDIPPASLPPANDTMPEPANDTIPPQGSLAPANDTPKARRAPLETYEAFESHLTSRGADSRFMSPGIHERVRTVIGRDVTPDEIDAFIGHDAFDGLPGIRQVFIEPAGSNEVRFTTEVGANVRLVRTFRREGDKLAVHHDLLRLDDKLQGEGIGPRVIKKQLEAYEALGVDQIDLDAAWVGRYYWPKLGFDASPGVVRFYRDEFEKYLVKRGAPPGAVSRLTKDIKSMRDIATTRVGTKELGKDFFLGDVIDAANLGPDGQPVRGDAAAGRLLENLFIKVRPGEPIYDGMKAEVSKPPRRSRKQATPQAPMTAAELAGRRRRRGKLERGLHDPQGQGLADDLIGNDSEPRDGWRRFDADDWTEGDGKDDDVKRGN